MDYLIPDPAEVALIEEGDLLTEKAQREIWETTQPNDQTLIRLRETLSDWQGKVEREGSINSQVLEIDKKLRDFITDIDNLLDPAAS